MSAVYEGGILSRRGAHIRGWGVSLGVHGVLGGLVIAALFVLSRPVAPPVFEWDVSLLDTATPMPTVTPTPRNTPAPVVTQKAAPQPQVTPAALPPPVVAAATPVASRADVAVPAPASAASVSAPAPAQAAPAPVMAAEPSPPRSEPVHAAAPPVANSSPDVGFLKDLLWRRTDALKKYPRLAERMGWEGRVLVKVVLAGDGRLVNAEIEESSGHETLDQNALQTVRAATPLKLDNQAWTQVSFLLPVVYRFGQ